MKRYKSWTLTDTQHDIWIESFATGRGHLPLPVNDPWSIRKRTLKGGLRDGVDLIEVCNGPLSYSILPTRGMGLWQGDYRGLFLGWKAPVQGPVHPKFVDLGRRNGLGWLTGFDEWLCRCGLNYNGAPGVDTFTDRHGKQHHEQLNLHGRIANLPAHYVEARVNLDPPYEISIIGQVEEGGLFFPRLLLTTTYTTVPGSNRLAIHDVVTNAGGEAAEVQMLYHLNMGAPFLEAGARVLAPHHQLCPRDQRAAEGIDTFDTYVGPTPGFAEQVNYYETVADASGHTLALLTNRANNCGIAIRVNQRELPCLSVWKNTMSIEEGYVTGLEPGTNYPNGRNFERRKGRVPVIPAGGNWQCSWSVEVHDSKEGVMQTLTEIAALQASSPAVAHRSPQDPFAPVG